MWEKTFHQTGRNREKNPLLWGKTTLTKFTFKKTSHRLQSYSYSSLHQGTAHTYQPSVISGAYRAQPLPRQTTLLGNLLNSLTDDGGNYLLSPYILHLAWTCTVHFPRTRLNLTTALSVHNPTLLLYPDSAYIIISLQQPCNHIIVLSPPPYQTITIHTDQTV